MLEESQETKEERLFDGRTSYEWYGEEDWEEEDESLDEGEEDWGGEG